MPFGRDRNQFQGWSQSSRGYLGHHEEIPELRSLVRHREKNNYACDIRDIECISACRSPLEEADSLDEFALRFCAGYMPDHTRARLKQCLAYDEVRILNRDPPGDRLVRHEWDPRLGLANDGGGHHFSAGRYLAGELGISIPIRGRLSVYEVNRKHLDALQERFALFLISPDKHASLNDALAEAQATYFYVEMGHHWGRAVAHLIAHQRSPDVGITSLFVAHNFEDLLQRLRRQLP